MAPPPACEEPGPELLRRLGHLEQRVREVLAQRRAADPNPDDPHRGLYVTEERVDALLGERRAVEAVALRDGPSGGRLQQVGYRFGLDPLDVELLVVAAAPDLDARFEPIYGYLNDDVTRRRATVGLALELCGQDPADYWARRHLSRAGPLVARGLIDVEEPERPLLSRGLRVPDTVTAWLIGDDQLEPELVALAASPVASPVAGLDQVKVAVAAGVRLLYTRENLDTAAWSWLASAFSQLDMPVVTVDLRLVPPGADVGELARSAARAARLRGGALLLAHLDEVGARSATEARLWTSVAEDTTVAATGAANWDATWSAWPPLLLAAPELSAAQRRVVWDTTLGRPLDDPAWRAVAAFRLTPEQVGAAARSALQAGTVSDTTPSPSDLQRAARAQNAASLERLARRVEPQVEWGDLVVPAEVETDLRGIAARVRQRPRVLGDWGLGAASAKGTGITALFSGESGTGKTLAAEVVSADLGLDLYVIDLSTVVDKYIGETEKNLDRIFTESERINAVLLLDEADAIFGKRSEVSDAKDRYANVEVAYLLQRMEQFAGVAILTTNLRANVDEAFLRRIDVLVDFPMPDETARRRLWQHNMGPAMPAADDIDVDFLSKMFRLSGGNIRNIVLAAAYLAADDNRPVRMADLIKATAAEYRKLGRLCLESEFGPWHRLATGPAA